MDFGLLANVFASMPLNVVTHNTGLVPVLIGKIVAGSSPGVVIGGCVCVGLLLFALL